jgi:predicted MFS family arabinose efflux permease
LEHLPQQPHPAPGPLAAAAVFLAGVCAFLQLYCTQPLLPLFTQLFHVTKASAGLTVSAATIAVAISAPFFGALTERLARKRVIVASIVGMAIPTLLAATATSLTQLIVWRFLQGVMVPGIVAVLVTYIGEEWPPQRVPFIMSLYVSGTALGGFLGRLSTGLLADRFSWRISFLALGLASFAGAAAVYAWLPHGRRRPTSGSLPLGEMQVPMKGTGFSVVNGTGFGVVKGTDFSVVKGTDFGVVKGTDFSVVKGTGFGVVKGTDFSVVKGTGFSPYKEDAQMKRALAPEASPLHQIRSIFHLPRLVATFAVGFNVLFSLVAVFTWITFHLAAPPFSLSTTALSSLFFVYLVGFLVTPAAGYIITRTGLRTGIAAAMLLSMLGVVLTLAPSLTVILLGLAMVCSGVFIAQTASQSFLRIATPPESRVTGAGLYMSCYYLGGTAAGVVPAIFWSIGKWPACVAFILCAQSLALAIALFSWRGPKPTQPIPESA